MRISDWSSDVCSSDLRDPRHRTVPDAARSSVVGRQGKVIVTKTVELPPQIFGAASKVALHMVAVDPQLRRRSRHQLGQTEGIFGRINVGLILTFSDDHCVKQTDRDAMFTCNIDYQSIIGRPHELRIQPPDTDRQTTRSNSTQYFD